MDHIFHARQIVSVSLRVLPSDSPLCVINRQQTWPELRAATVSPPSLGATAASTPQLDLFWAGQVSGGRSVKLSFSVWLKREEGDGEWRLCVRVCVRACSPRKKSGLLICFPGSSLKGEQDTPEAPSDLLPHPSLHFLSSVSLFPRRHHLSLVPSAFSPRFFTAPRPYAPSSVVLARSGLCMATALISRYSPKNSDST